MYTLKVEELESVAEFLTKLESVSQHLKDAWYGSEQEGDLNEGEAARVTSLLSQIEEQAELLNSIVQELDDARALDEHIEIDYS
jgi:hypothetical protein